MPTVQPTPPRNKAIRYARSPRVQLDITEDLIAESTKRDSSHCMIAEAVKRAVPGARSVAVDLQTIRFTDPLKAQRYVYLTPRRAQVALVNFDQGKAPEPFQIQLRGGSVTKSGRAKPSEPKNIITNKPKVSDTKKFLPQRHATSKTVIPEISGGTPPPIGPLSSTSYKGRRRAFGLRALEQ